MRSAGPVARMLGVGAASFVLFALLGSQQYASVDGALRCLDVFRHPVLAFSGNNHLLYPANVLIWQRLAGLFGAHPRDPLAYLRLTQLMNAAAAAGAVALLYRMVHAATASHAVAATAAAGLALSRAFLIHATSSAEPMVGLFWALVAVSAASSAMPRPRVWPAVVAGIALALSFASYASMFLVAPAVLLQLRAGAGARRRAVVLLAAAAIATATLFGAAYAGSGTAAPGGMLRRFFALPGSSVWGGVSLSNVANAPLGLAQGLLPVLPPGYAGLTSLGASGTLRLAWLVVALAGVAALCVALAREAWRAREGPLRSRGAATLTTAAAAGLLASLVAPLAWAPLYDKLWILPIALLWLVGGAAVADARAGRSAWLARGALLLVAGEAVVNLAWAVPAHLKPSPYLAPSQVMASAVKPGDLAVLDWDPVSLMYAGLWGAGRSIWSLPAEGVERGPASLVALDSAVAATRRRGADVYFLGVLDETRANWDAFLGRRLHLPFEALDGYRRAATVVASFGTAAQPLTLRRLRASSL